MVSFNECFDDFVRERYGSVLMNAKKIDPEYRKLDREFSKLFHMLREIVGEQNLKFFMEYEAASCARESYGLEKSYKAGLRDGLKLSQVE